MKLFDLSGRIAVITGTSRGIGRELAHGFAEAGATVVGCARSYEAAEKTAAELRARAMRHCRCWLTLQHRKARTR